MHTAKRKAGFTLIELLVAVLVIGILAALVYPKFSPIKERTYVSAMKNSLNKLVTAQENHMDANNVYAVGSSVPGTGYAPDDDVINLTITSLDPQYGWIATVGHAKTEAQCGIAYGAAGAGGVEYTGKTVCSVTGPVTPS